MSDSHSIARDGSRFSLRRLVAMMRKEFLQLVRR